MQMTKYYPTDELVPGMVTAGEVRTKGGQLIVENGVSLTDRLISRIKFYAIPQVSVTEDPIPATKKEEQVEVPSHVVNRKPRHLLIRRRLSALKNSRIFRFPIPE